MERLLSLLVIASAAAAPAQVRSGSYVGDGVDDRVVDVGFQPDGVSLRGNLMAPGVLWTSSMPADSARLLAQPTTGPQDLGPNRVQGLAPGSSTWVGGRAMA